MVHRPICQEWGISVQLQMGEVVRQAPPIISTFIGKRSRVQWFSGKGLSLLEVILPLQDCRQSLLRKLNCNGLCCPWLVTTGRLCFPGLSTRHLSLALHSFRKLNSGTGTATEASGALYSQTGPVMRIRFQDQNFRD